MVGGTKDGALHLDVLSTLWGLAFLLHRVGLQSQAATWTFLSLHGSPEEQVGSRVLEEGSYRKHFQMSSRLDPPDKYPQQDRQGQSSSWISGSSVWWPVP